MGVLMAALIPVQHRVCHSAAVNSVPDTSSEYCAELLVFSLERRIRTTMPSAPAVNAWRLHVVMLTTTKPRGRNLPETVSAKDVQSRARVGSLPKGGEHLRQFAGSGTFSNKCTSEERLLSAV
jgi:hypothetical protein